MRVLKYVFGIAALCVLLFLTDLSATVASLSHIPGYSLAALAALSFLLIGVSVLKWQLFLKKLGTRKSFWELFGLYLVGYFINLIMPSYVGGDVVRSMYVGRGGDQHLAFSATFLERYTGLLAMVLMAGVSTFFATSITFEISLIVWALVVGLLIASLLMCSGWAKRIAPAIKLSTHLTSSLEKIQAGLRVGLTDPHLLTKAMGLSVLFHLLTILNTWVVCSAVGWSQASFLDLLVIVPLILLIGALPVSPQGLGIQEGAFFFFLKAIGAPPGVAVAAPLVLRAKSYMLALFGGVLWVAHRRRTHVPHG